jgi:hypothetical protein
MERGQCCSRQSRRRCRFPPVGGSQRVASASWISTALVDVRRIRWNVPQCRATMNGSRTRVSIGSGATPLITVNGANLRLRAESRRRWEQRRDDSGDREAEGVLAFHLVGLRRCERSAIQHKCYAAFDPSVTSITKGPQTFRERPLAWRNGYVSVAQSPASSN